MADSSPTKHAHARTKSRPARSTTQRTSSTTSRTCSICNKQFCRGDALKRHVRDHHADKVNLLAERPSRRRSCIRCALHKLKCSREPCCKECTSNKLVCMYDFHASRDAAEPGEVGAQSSSITPSSTLTTAHDDPAFSSATTRPAEISEPINAAGAPTINEDLAARTAHLNTAVLSTEVDPDDCPREDRSPDRQVANQQFPTSSQLLDLPNDTVSYLLNGLESSPPVGGNTLALSTAYRGVSDAPPAPWLFHDVDLFENSNHAAQHQQDNQLHMLSPSFFYEVGSFHGAFDFGINLDAMDAPVESRPDHAATNRTVLGMSTDLAPLSEEDLDGPRSKRPRLTTTEDTQKHSGQALSFPSQLPTPEPLRDVWDVVDEPASCLAARIRSILSWDRGNTKSHIQPIDTFSPSDAEMIHYWDSYFSSFDKLLPILHRANITPESNSDLLLLVITAIGASFVENPMAEGYYRVGSAKLVELMNFVKLKLDGGDPTFGHNDDDVKLGTSYHIRAAFCVWLYHSALNHHSTLAEAFTPVLRFFAREMEETGEDDDAVVALSPPKSQEGGDLDEEVVWNFGRRRYSSTRKSVHEQSRLALLEDRDDEEVDRRWRSWIDRESHKRLAWALVVCQYILSASSGYYITECRLEEIDLPLPCNDSMWNAADARTWFATFPWSYKPPRDAATQSTLRGLIQNRIPVEKVPQFGRLLFALIITFDTAIVNKLRGGGCSRIGRLDDCELRAAQRQMLQLADKLAAFGPTVQAV